MQTVRPFWLMLGLALAQLGLVAGQQLGVTIATPVVDGSAGKVITLVASVENSSSEPVEANVDVALPEGWTLLLRPKRVHLTAGETRGVVLPLVVPQHASAGIYEIRLEFETDTAQISDIFEVRVPSIREVRLEVESAPVTTLPHRYETTFLVSNRGNRTEHILFSAKSNRNLVLRPEPDKIDLAPGESAPIRVVVPAIQGLARPSRHIVTLTASPSDNGDATTALALTEVIAVAQPERLAFHTFPVEFRFDLAAFQAGNDARATVATGALAAHGRGTLSEKGETVIGFSVRYGSTAATRHLTIDVADPEYRMLLGDQRQSLGQLLPDAKGFGLTLHANQTNLPVRVYGLSTAVGARAGFSVGEIRLGDTEYTIRGTFGPDMAIASTRSRYTERISDSGHAVLELEPSFDFLTGSPALQSRVQLTEANYEFATSLVHQSPGYLQRQDSRTDFTVSARFDLLSDIELEGQFETDIRGTYSSRTASISVTGAAGELQWNLRYKFDSRLWSGSTTNSETFSAGATFMPNDAWGLGGAFSWSRLQSFPSNSDWETMNFRAIGSRPMSSGSFLFGMGAGFDVTAQQLSYTTMNTGWRGSLAAATTGELQLDLHVATGASARLRSGLTHELASGNHIEAEVEVRTGPAAGTEIDAAVRLVVPVDLRLSRKEGVSQIHGRVQDAKGNGIPDLIVSLAGFTVLTEADGSFNFPAIPEGEQVLFIPGLPDSLVTVPRLPLKISAPKRQPVELRAHAAATVRGEVKVVGPKVGTTALGATDDVADGGRSISPAGMRIKLTDETGLRTTLTNSAGGFEFARLPPGNWTASIDDDSIPDGYAVAPAAIGLTTEAGELTEVEFAVEPVRRAIRFMDGGTLGCSGSPAHGDDCGLEPPSSPNER